MEQHEEQYAALVEEIGDAIAGRIGAVYHSTYAGFSAHIAALQAFYLLAVPHAELKTHPRLRVIAARLAQPEDFTPYANLNTPTPAHVAPIVRKAMIAKQVATWNGWVAAVGEWLKPNDTTGGEA